MRIQLPSPKRSTGAPQFSVHVCCDQTAGWIKMPLGREVELCRGHILLDGDPAPPIEAQPPHFSAHVYCGQTAGWIKMPLGTKIGSAQATLCYMVTQLPLSKKGHTPQFSAHAYCGERSPISATAEHLLRRCCMSPEYVCCHDNVRRSSYPIILAAVVSLWEQLQQQHSV